MDLFQKFRNDKGPIGRWQEKTEGYFVFPKLEGELSNRMQFRGKDVICWSVNNYLGLGNHPEVRKVDAVSAEKWGLAYPMGSRLMSGHTTLHEQLQNELAEFVGKESAFLLNFGYQGFMSVVDSLTSRHDVIIYDSEMHACIMDAIRMHTGKKFSFDHNNVESLRKRLQRASDIVDKTNGGILVISEGVFGMRGDQGKLKEIAALKEEFDFRFLVDDAHGFGVLGDTGAGAGEYQGVQDDIDIYLATFAKSMASIGAFVAGEADVINFLKYNMRSQVYAKSLPMPLVEGALKRLDMLRSMPELRENLWNVVNLLQEGLQNRGYEIGDTNSCVTPVYLNGSVEEATQLVFDLRENHGIFCSIVVPPVVPQGMMILRLIPTAEHTEQDVDETLEAFDAVSSKLKNGEYQNEVPQF